ncbi:exodeoxyribonuclease V subunit beta [uncultured Castellaniella sp.]|uniref:exodeoxyribonuclease V subunit beta n=1 Tax=uncultured Castellaniella sp. TaxID=647907 RepID=UPI00262B2AD0|nr:exodeoxyribonuclease V subunit beta [uncultured Castellaniella sp.]
MMVDASLTPREPPQVDPLRFVLQGSHLIEASAGTGKTWTIAALYARLVLGHGGQAARLPGQILVLTFTDAAAQELRDRIRRRLSEAAAGFAGGGAGSDPVAPLEDPFLDALRADYPQDLWPACARTLDLAAQSMDEAAISTIHAWCARVLKEHAFDSASQFEQELLTDLNEAKRQVAWDYWRACVAALDDRALGELLAVWASPDALHQSLSPVLTQEGLPPPSDETLAQVCDRARADRLAALQVLKAPWAEQADAFQAWLASRDKQIRIRSNDGGNWLQALRDWAAQPDRIEPALSKTAWDALVPEGLRERWQGDGPAPEPPAASLALLQLKQALRDLPTVQLPARRHALAWMADRLRQTLSRRAAMGFDGLLTGLDAALRGARGEPLAQTLRQQFPVVLIDEFQDTDPVQYRIFDRIYRVAAPQPQTTLIFIGDPKQAIYGFRGADVQTYLKAAQACGDRVQTLDCNYRSASELVRAVNHCFDRQGSEPVFPTGLEGESIAFHPVRAQGRDERWTVAGRAPSALQAAWIGGDDEPLSVGAYCAQAAQACARKVADWLRLGRQGQAGFRSGKDLRAVRPSDMAILVNGRDEAGLIRDALRELGVRSVYLSDRRSVYESETALELGFILNACAHPDDEQAIRAALAAPLLGLDIPRLAMLAEDEWAWDEQVERFQFYHGRWRQRGVLPMLRQLLHDFAVPSRLLARGAPGERQLTDCLHLAELLQQASVQLDGEEALLHYLARQREFLDADADAEGARRLRLESDEALVRVVTVHKSKGLEYPLVFLPFVCRGRSTKPKTGPQALHWEGRRQWLLQLDAEQARQAQREELGEETRKLYVALTRARHAVWLALGDTGRESGLTHVLGGDVRQAWDRRCADHPEQFAWDPEPAAAGWPEDVAVAPASPRPDEIGPARRLSGFVVGDPWWIASYSALELADRPARAAGRSDGSPDTALEDVLREEQGGRLEQTFLADAASEPAGLSGFPRGSEAGTFLHGLLEWAAQRRFRHLDGMRDMIARRCAVRGWESQIDVLHDWLSRFAQTDWRPQLPGDPRIRLDGLQACLPEMEFWLPVRQVSVAELDRRITEGVFQGVPRPALAAQALNGLFKGFIDLSFQVGERYYLIDYKSNHLGPRLADYAAPALRQAACAARYDVQMLMYVLALHRQLRLRLPDYDYRRHMGGAVYLFLRGQDAPGQGLLSLCPPQDLVESLDALFAGAGHE